MRDIELYRVLLGLTTPWTVSAVDVDMTGQRVVVRVDAGAGPYPCPECGATGPGYDSKPRRWRHLGTMQFTTWIEANVPRMECETHGVKQLRVPWAEPGSQFTALFERLAIDLLRECSITGAVGLLRISWDEGWGIKAQAVTRGLARRGPDVVSCHTIIATRTRSMSKNTVRSSRRWVPMIGSPQSSLDCKTNHTDQVIRSVHGSRRHRCA